MCGEKKTTESSWTIAGIGLKCWRIFCCKSGRAIFLNLDISLVLAAAWDMPQSSPIRATGNAQEPRWNLLIWSKEIWSIGVLGGADLTVSWIKKAQQVNPFRAAEELIAAAARDAVSVSVLFNPHNIHATVKDPNSLSWKSRFQARRVAAAIAAASFTVRDYHYVNQKKWLSRGCS